MTPAEKAIERLSTMFGEPKTNNPEAFIAEYAGALTGYDAEVLDLAIDRVIRSATFWPKPAEVLAEVNRIAADKYRHRRPEKPEHGPLLIVARTDKELAAANELVANMQRFMSEHVTVSVPKTNVDWKRGQRDGFEAMQRGGGLSQLSKRMSGDDR